MRIGKPTYAQPSIVIGVVEDENKMRGGCELRENEKESEDTYSSIWKSEYTSSSAFTHIIYIFFYS